MHHMFEQTERFKLAITNLSSLAGLSLYHEQVYLINSLFVLHYYHLKTIAQYVELKQILKDIFSFRTVLYFLCL